MSTEKCSRISGIGGSPLSQLELYEHADTATLRPAAAPTTAHELRAGWIYILSNPSMPSLLKIGRSKYGGESRADIFYKNDTAVPTPFELEYESYSEDCIWDEAELHKKLADYRINGSREFFKCAVQVAIDVCNSQISKVKPTEGLVNAEIRIREVADGEFNQSERCDMGHRIGLLMLTSHMTATDIAKACGVTRRQLYNWKEGQVPREKRLVKLASVLGVSREYLLYGGDDE